MLARCLPRFASRSFHVAVYAALAAGLGCSSSSGTPTGSSSTGGMGTGPCGLVNVDNSEFCASEALTPDCTAVGGFLDDVCGLPVATPTTPLARSSTVMEFAGSGPPDLACLEVGHYPTAGTPQTVKAVGRARIFSHGCQSNNVTIEFFQVVRDGSDNEGNIGASIGSAVVTENDCFTDGTGVAVPSADCTTRYECPYEFPGLPTETEMIVRTSGTMWQPLYDYNIYISNSEVSGGTWQHDVRALAITDYAVIPTAAYGHTVTPGNGVVAGEVHDCGDVRLSGAIVNVDKQNAALEYFSGSESAPSPDTNATETNSLGLYAAFDIVPGTLTVGAVGTDNNAATALGFVKARIYPNAVTAVTFRGVLPFQVPAK